MPERLVTENIAAEAVRLFLEIQPRTLSLAGGGTPRAFYERLGQADRVVIVADPAAAGLLDGK